MKAEQQKCINSEVFYARRIMVLCIDWKMNTSARPAT